MVASTSSGTLSPCWTARVPYARVAGGRARPWLSSSKDIAEKTCEGDRKAPHCEPHHDPID